MHFSTTHLNALYQQCMTVFVCLINILLYVLHCCMSHCCSIQSVTLGCRQGAMYVVYLTQVPVVTFFKKQNSYNFVCLFCNWTRRYWSAGYACIHPMPPSQPKGSYPSLSVGFVNCLVEKQEPSLVLLLLYDDHLCLVNYIFAGFVIQWMQF